MYFDARDPLARSLHLDEVYLKQVQRRWRRHARNRVKEHGVAAVANPPPSLLALFEDLADIPPGLIGPKLSAVARERFAATAPQYFRFAAQSPSKATPKARWPNR